MKTILALLLSALALPAADPTVISGSGNMTMSGNISFAAPTPDTTGPLLIAAEIQPNGTNIIFTFNEPVSYGSGGSGWVSIFPSSGEATLVYSNGVGTTALTYGISRIIYASEAITSVAYDQQGDGWQDAYGNDVADTNFTSVVNSSTNTLPPASYVLVENFETNVFWSTNNPVIELNYSSYALEGTNSCYIPNAGSYWCWTNIAAADEYYGYFLMRPVSANFDAYLTLSAVGSSNLMKVGISANDSGWSCGKWRMYHGEWPTWQYATGDTNSIMACQDTTYHVWWYWKKGTGSDGIYQMWVTNSVGATKPGAPLISVTNGTAALQPPHLSLECVNSAAIFDKIRVSSTEIGSSPE